MKIDDSFLAVLWGCLSIVHGLAYYHTGLNSDLLRFIACLLFAASSFLKS